MQSWKNKLLLACVVSTAFYVILYHLMKPGSVIMYSKPRGTNIYNMTTSNDIIRNDRKQSILDAEERHIRNTLNMHASGDNPFIYYYPVSSDQIIPKKPEIITILAWTAANGGSRQFSSSYRNCPQPNCELVRNKSLIRTTDAVIFSQFNRRNEIPPYHPASQKWLFVTHEAPGKHRIGAMNLTKWNYHVNLTIAANPDADLYVPYGYYYKEESDFTLPMYPNRTKPAAWLVSHCRTDSQRELYVFEMMKHIHIDVYGKCGASCPHDCWNYIENNYIFYISFENSDCEGYITEKLWANAFKHNLIPIVRGRRSGYEKYLPPGSYIHTNDFETVESLTQHLHQVYQNATLYESYFLWKRKYKFGEITGGKKMNCMVCKLLHESWYWKPQSWDLATWWASEQSCHFPNTTHNDYLSFNSSMI